jgi:hypothetical protein
MMNFSIVFNNTGDTIPFTAISPGAYEVLEYYIEKLNELNVNSFSSSQDNNLVDLVNKVSSSIVSINEWIYEILDEYIDTHNWDDYVDQRVLNKLHADWVNSQSRMYDIQEKRTQYNNSAQSELVHSLYPADMPSPSVAGVISRLGLFPTYAYINLCIHYLEQYFLNMKYSISTSEWVEFKNPFSKELLTNDICNFSLSFNHLGRPLYNKFRNFDLDLEYDDENTFNELLGFVTIKFAPTETIPLSTEYVLWCQQHNRVPSGAFFNIGNIPQLADNLSSYRKVILRNSMANNHFTIQLNKG